MHTSENNSLLAAELEVLLGSLEFARALQLRHILEYLVNRGLAGEGDRITEFDIGFEALGRREFDPQSDSIARKEMGRLRRKLDSYYCGEGAARSWRIVFDRGSYCPRVERHTPPSAEKPGVKGSRLLFLPIEPLNFDDDHGFCAGLTEDLMVALAAGGHLQIVPRITAFHFRGRTGDARDFATQTGADWVIESTAKEEPPDELSLTVRLVDGTSGLSSWAVSARGSWDAPLPALEELAARISAQLGVVYPARARRQLAARHSRDPIARDLLVRAAQANHQRSREGIMQAFGYLQKAIERDPSYASAYAVLAQTHVVAGAWGAAPRDQMPRARQAAEHALALNPDLGEAHWALGAVQLLFDWNHNQAGETLDLARQLDPLVSATDWWYEVYVASSGRVEEAADRMEQLAVRDPFSAPLWTQACSFSYNARRFDRALEHGRRACELDPLFFRPHMMMAQTFAAIEEWDAAIAHARTAVEGSRGLPAALGTLAYCLGLAGRRSEVAPVSAALEERSRQGYVSGFALAGVPIGLGDIDGAFACCQKAIDDRDPFIVWLDVWVWLDTIRGDARFAELRRQAGLA